MYHISRSQLLQGYRWRGEQHRKSSKQIDKVCSTTVAIQAHALPTGGSAWALVTRKAQIHITRSHISHCGMMACVVTGDALLHPPDQNLASYDADEIIPCEISRGYWHA